MEKEKKGLALILHSGSYDRIYHGLSIALAALALGRDTKLFFTYWALEYLKEKKAQVIKLDSEGESHRKVLEDNMRKGHIENVSELIGQTKAMGGKIYACTNSMGLLNISRDELKNEVDKSMGLVTFLTESSASQILFI